MTFISYAQNFEDVMLWRALKHINNGFYIDIGANDPVVDSVSLAFYENGWRGVHVEPTMQYSNKLRQARPDEIVEQVAIGNGDGSFTFYEFENTGLSTADQNNAQIHKQAGYSCIESQVRILSLDTLFDRIGQRVIHWLKVDVEGLEKSVLESWRESTARPWVLVIESTRPSTQDEDYAGWEPLVLAKGYQFAYFDGLNRFYVYSGQSYLLNAFKIPPNIFDDFMLSGTACQPFYQLIGHKVKQAEAKAQQAENVLEAVYNSRSWRYTALLRWAEEKLRIIRENFR